MFTNTNNNVVASLTSLANVSNAVFKASLTGVLCLHVPFICPSLTPRIQGESCSTMFYKRATNKIILALSEIFLQKLV